MANRDKGKTEHAGAKHTRGFWGHKSKAKDTSATQRRINDKMATRYNLMDPWFNDYSLEDQLLDEFVEENQYDL